MAALNREGQPLETDFSISAGGAFYRALQPLGFFRHRLHPVQVGYWIGLTWLPLLILSLVEGAAWGHRVRIPLLSDPSVFGRFIIALPLLLSADVVIGGFVGRAVVIFNSSGIISEEEIPVFHAALEKTARLRDSGKVEFFLAVFACIPFYLLLADYEWVAIGVSSWHGTTSLGLSPAGWWFLCVSSPVLRFLMFRWVWRYVLWTYLLVRISRLNLLLVPTHPDRLGGLGFLLHTQKQFGLLAAATASVIAGQFANEIVYFGETFDGVLAPAGVFIASALIVVLAPVTCFSFKLFSARKEGLLRNNGVAWSVTNRFDALWTRGIGPPPGTMIGTQDPSSLFDYIGVYDVIRQTQVIPINKRAVIYVALLAAAPFASLWLLNKPLERLIAELLKRLLE